MTDNRQTSIDTAASIIREDDSVIASAVLAFAALNAKYEKAIADFKASVAATAPALDMSALDAAIAEGKDVAAPLAQAIAINTDASAEVHSNDGGSGSSDTVVDPASVDTTAVVAAAGG